MILETASNPGWLSNTYLVADGDGGAAVFIDSGGPVDALLRTVRERRLRVTHLLNTHHHHDHVAENRGLKAATGALLGAHRLDAPRIDGIDMRLEDGQTISTGGLVIRVLHIPGHTAGQAAFLVNDAVCFTGDTLFRGSVGGTRAPGHTTFTDLRRSLMERLMTLPDDTRVAPGHRDMTTIGQERERNPFIRVMRGVDPEGTERAIYAGSEVQLVVWARDYDGGHKAWVRHREGGEDTVPGSQVRRLGAPNATPWNTGTGS
jgi:glyoxylase-like metal-dependent hydrolase (beta-lactamase superfamily II)